MMQLPANHPILHSFILYIEDFLFIIYIIPETIRFAPLTSWHQFGYAIVVNIIVK